MGEIADMMIEQFIFGDHHNYEDYWEAEPMPRKYTASEVTEIAEGKLKDAKRVAEGVNKGVIQW